jgi:hypothetical protein
MDGAEYRFRRGRIILDDQGIAVVEARAAEFFVPWHAVGHIELGRDEDAQHVRVIRMHLADGRTVSLPAPCAEREPAAAIFRAWRRYAKERVHEPHDEIPHEFRAAAARRLDPVQDRVPADASAGAPVADRTILSRWPWRRRGRTPSDR